MNPYSSSLVQSRIKNYKNKKWAPTIIDIILLLSLMILGLPAQIVIFALEQKGIITLHIFTIYSSTLIITGSVAALYYHFKFNEDNYSKR